MRWRVAFVAFAVVAFAVEASWRGLSDQSHWADVAQGLAVCGLYVVASALDARSARAAD